MDTLSMRYRRLGRTNLQVSELALGTVELGLVYGVTLPGESGHPNEEEASKILNRAIDVGINLIDTARAYGASEEIIGRAISSRRSEVILASKFTILGHDRALLTGDELRRHFENSLEASLWALQTDYLDLYQVHAGTDPEVLLRGEVIELLERACAQGKVRYSGLSSYGLTLPEVALDLNCFDTLQVAYSILDRRMEERVFPYAEHRDVGVIVRSALLKGALTERADYLPAHLAPLQDRSRTFRRMVQELSHGQTPVQVALRFCLSRPVVGTVLVGVRNTAELDEAVDIRQVPDLDQETLDRLRLLAMNDELLLDASTWGIP
jgi:aryl-alcohol dehydrogenase-like predicted oxidoreductase